MKGRDIVQYPRFEHGTAHLFSNGKRRLVFRQCRVIVADFAVGVCRIVQRSQIKRRITVAGPSILEIVE